jgi:hypothetical protein
VIEQLARIPNIESLTASLNGAQPAPKKQSELWPEFLTAKEILQAPKDPTRWIVEDCLPAGGASVLVAKPKVGKSTIAADLAISVARGETFLGRATQQSSVAYVFLDGPLTDIADTFMSLGLRESDPVFIHAGSAPADAIAWILAAVKNKGARLVIIDVLQKLCRFENINDYSEVTTKMEPLLEASRAGNCHIMTLHHAKKDSRDDLDAAIGSTAIRGLCYTYLFAKRLPESNRRIISSDQRGGKNFDQMGLGFDKITHRLKIEGTVQEIEIEEAEPKVVEFIESEGREVTEREIGQAVPIRAFIISRALRKLYRRGSVERTGKGRRGSPFLYSLASVLFDENGAANGPTTVTGSFSSSSRETKPAHMPGRDSSNAAQGNGNAQEILFPKNGKRMGRETENQFSSEKPGRESEDGWEIIVK